MQGSNSKLGKCLTTKVPVLPMKNNINGKAVTVNATAAVPLVSVKEQIKTTFLI